jgi:thiamine kinase-like enzyme
MTEAEEIAKQLPCWRSEVTPISVAGGITNKNFLVEDEGRRYIVRVGADIPVHHIMRFNEQAASRAAEQAGISPAVMYESPGAMVLDFIDGETLNEAGVRDEKHLGGIIDLVQKAHRLIPQYLRGPSMVFWAFHVIRDYAATLKEQGSVHVPKLGALLEHSEQLERAIGPVELVFGHNDLLAANFIDDGSRLWLIDWDYAGFNSPLFDLGGLAANNGFDGATERWMLERYYEAPVTDDLMRRYFAMKCASLIRETLWSMVSEIYSDIDFDYPAYSKELLDRVGAEIAGSSGSRKT